MSSTLAQDLSRWDGLTKTAWSVDETDAMVELIQSFGRT